MFTVFFKNEGITSEAPENFLLVDIIRETGISFEAPCNGIAVCKKCLVTVFSGDDLQGKDVLACQYSISSDITVETKKQDIELISINHGVTIDTDLNCDTVLKDIESLDLADLRPYSNKINNGKLDLSILREIARLERRKFISPLQGVFLRNELIDIIEYNKDNRLLGLAIDLGTTGVSLFLLDLISGRILEKFSFLNPQFEFGGDVLTRVSYCMEDRENTGKLSRLVISKLNEVISCFEEKGYEPNSIYRVVVAGNTIMQHIFAGIDPTILAKNPYRPIFDRELNFKILELNANKAAAVSLLPSISSYIGGDIVAGIISTGFNKEERNALFIDIGTNGEIVLKLNGNLYATSTAAGPALEGMNISCGQRAVSGAIEKFYFDESGSLCFDTIDNAKATGVCGSGLIDLIALLISNKTIDNFGRLKNKKYDISEDISLLQKDVRQVQLAKAAVATGIKMLIAEAGGAYEDIEIIYIAGSFGYHLDPDNLKKIGLIDKTYSGEIIFVGNSSLEGARLFLLNSDIQAEMSDITRNIKPVELSRKDEFQNVFVKEIPF